jgi:DNA-binding GntR family transcriptional regulator
VKTLSQEHEVSHVTAEKAMAILKAEGLVTTVIGKGAYVTRKSPGR